MFGKKKEVIDGEEYHVKTRHYVQFGRRRVSVRRICYLALFAVVVMLFIATRPEMLPTVE